MVGALEPAWVEAKTDFYLGFIARVLSAHAMMELNARRAVMPLAYPVF